MIQFEIDPTPEETLRACRALVAHSLPPSRWSLILVAVYALVVASAYAFARSTMPATVFIGVGSVMLVLTLWERYTQARTRLLLGGDAHGREKHYVEVSATGVRAWCSHMESRYAWPDFAAIGEDNEFFLFRRSGGQGTAVPKRLLDDASDSVLRASLAEWVGGEKLQLARRLR